MMVPVSSGPTVYLCYYTGVRLIRFKHHQLWKALEFDEIGEDGKNYQAAKV